MFTTNTLRRSAALCAIGGVGILTGGEVIPEAAFAGIPAEDYYSSYTTPADDPALVQEQYLSSYGNPEPIAAPQATGDTGGDTPRLELTLSAAGALAIAGLGATQVRRVRIRRRSVAEAGL